MFRPSYTSFLAELSDRFQAAGYDRYPQTPALASELFQWATRAAYLAGEISMQRREPTTGPAMVEVAAIRRAAKRHAIEEPKLPRRVS